MKNNFFYLKKFTNGWGYYYHISVGTKNKGVQRVRQIPTLPKQCWIGLKLLTLPKGMTFADSLSPQICECTNKGMTHFSIPLNISCHYLVRLRTQLDDPGSIYFKKQLSFYQVPCITLSVYDILDDKRQVPALTEYPYNRLIIPHRKAPRQYHQFAQKSAGQRCFLIMEGLKNVAINIQKHPIPNVLLTTQPLPHQAIGLDQKEVREFRGAVEGEKKISKIKQKTLLLPGVLSSVTWTAGPMGHFYLMSDEGV